MKIQESTNPYQGQEARLAEQRLTKPTKAVSLSSSLSMSCANVFQQLKRSDGRQSYKIIQVQIQIQILNFSFTPSEKLYVSSCAHILRTRNIQKQGRLYFGYGTACRYKGKRISKRSSPKWEKLDSNKHIQDQDMQVQSNWNGGKEGRKRRLWQHADDVLLRGHFSASSRFWRNHYHPLALLRAILAPAFLISLEKKF